MVKKVILHYPPMHHDTTVFLLYGPRRERCSPGSLPRPLLTQVLIAWIALLTQDNVHTTSVRYIYIIWWVRRYYGWILHECAAVFLWATGEWKYSTRKRYCHNIYPPYTLTQPLIFHTPWGVWLPGQLTHQWLVSFPDPTYEREGLVTSSWYLGLH